MNYSSVYTYLVSFLCTQCTTSTCHCWILPLRVANCKDIQPEAVNVINKLEQMAFFARLDDKNLTHNKLLPTLQISFQFSNDAVEELDDPDEDMTMLPLAHLTIPELTVFLSQTDLTIENKKSSCRFIETCHGNQFLPILMHLTNAASLNYLLQVCYETFCIRRDYYTFKMTKEAVSVVVDANLKLKLDLILDYIERKMLRLEHANVMHTTGQKLQARK